MITFQLRESNLDLVYSAYSVDLTLSLMSHVPWIPASSFRAYLVSLTRHLLHGQTRAITRKLRAFVVRWNDIGFMKMRSWKQTVTFSKNVLEHVKQE